MNRYDISLQVTMPVGPADSLLWFIQFQPVGRLSAYSTPHALRIARELGWRAPVAAPADPRIELPQLTTAPVKLPRKAHHRTTAPSGKTANFRQKGRL